MSALKPGTGANGGGVFREHVGVVPRIAPDDDARRGRAGHSVEEVPREPRGGTTHDHAVHAIRSGAERAPKARGAELQAGRKPILDGGHVAALDQRF